MVSRLVRDASTRLRCIPLPTQICPETLLRLPAGVAVEIGTPASSFLTLDPLTPALEETPMMASALPNGTKVRATCALVSRLPTVSLRSL